MSEKFIKHRITGLEVPAYAATGAMQALGVSAVRDAKYGEMFREAAQKVSSGSLNHLSEQAVSIILASNTPQAQEERRLRVQNSLSQARETVFQAYTTRYGKAIDGYLEENAPQYLKDQKAASSEDGRSWQWSEWLTSVASDAQLLEFLTWHHDELEAAQEDPDLKKETDKQRDRYIADVQDGIANGWLSNDIDIEALTKEVRRIPVYIGSFFDLNMEGIGGYYQQDLHNPQGSFIAHAPLAPDLPALRHELNHAVLEATSHEPAEEQRTDEPLRQETWLYETLTDHIANFMQRGRLETIIDMGDNSYHDYARLVTFIHRYGTKQVETEVATRAYSGSRHERDAYYQLIDGAWGTNNTLTKIGKHLRQEEHSLKKHGHDKFDSMRLAVDATIKLLFASPKMILGENCTVPGLAPIGYTHVLPIVSDKGSRAQIELSRVSGIGGMRDDIPWSNRN